MESEKNNKYIFLLVIGILVLIILVSGITYVFLKSQREAADVKDNDITTPQIKYWNDEFQGISYHFPEIPNTTYTSLVELKAGYDDFASNPIYIKTTSSKNQVCVYYNDNEFCLGANYWDTNADKTKKKLQTEMAEALKINETDLSCKADSDRVWCQVSNFECAVETGSYARAYCYGKSGGCYQHDENLTLCAW